MLLLQLKLLLQQHWQKKVGWNFTERFFWGKKIRIIFAKMKNVGAWPSLEGFLPFSHLTGRESLPPFSHSLFILSLLSLSLSFHLLASLLSLSSSLHSFTLLFLSLSLFSSIWYKKYLPLIDLSFYSFAFTLSSNSIKNSLEKIALSFLLSLSFSLSECIGRLCALCLCSFLIVTVVL